MTFVILQNTAVVCTLAQKHVYFMCLEKVALFFVVVIVFIFILATWKLNTTHIVPGDVPLISCVKMLCTRK